jgi:hypothetical protein
LQKFHFKPQPPYKIYDVTGLWWPTAIIQNLNKNVFNFAKIELNLKQKKTQSKIQTKYKLNTN